MKDMQHDMDLEEIHTPRDTDPSDGWDPRNDDEYLEEVISCVRCGRKGPRYEIEGHSCSEAA